MRSCPDLRQKLRIKSELRINRVGINRVGINRVRPVYCCYISAQDRSPFCILHIMNEILQHRELMYTFLVGNPTQDRGPFLFSYILTKFCNILRYGKNLKFETIVQFFRKIIQLNAVSIVKSPNEYYRKIISKNGRKMDLYPALIAIFLGRLSNQMQFKNFKNY